MRQELKVELVVYYELAFNGSLISAKNAAHSRMLVALQSALLDIGVSFSGTRGILYSTPNEEQRDGAAVAGLGDKGAPAAELRQRHLHPPGRLRHHSASVAHPLPLDGAEAGGR
jgi:hypothetical protein